MIACWPARFPNSANFSTRRARHFSNGWMPGCWRTKPQEVQEARRRRPFAWEPACITFKTNRSAAKTDSCMPGAMTVKRTRTHMVIGTAAAMLLASCDGTNVAGIKGSGSPTPAAATAGALGPITGFGSVFVDGVEYSTSNAQISIDHQPG